VPSNAGSVTSVGSDDRRSSGTPTLQTDRLEDDVGELTDLIAGVPVSDLHASTEWYRRFFGREPDLVAGDEILWDVRPGATLFIEPNPAAAGSGHITFAVTGLDELLEQLNAAGIEHEPIETYDNGVRHVSIPDPDGNLIAYAEAPPASG
jgi:catechol 2,3-dioxygenase-like lactoylglutathione lyase family enzyme